MSTSGKETGREEVSGIARVVTLVTGMASMIYALGMISSVLRPSGGQAGAPSPTQTDTLSQILNVVTTISNQVASISTQLDNANAQLAGIRQAIEALGGPSGSFWVHGSEVESPSANTTLVSYTVPSGSSCYIYGFFISTSDSGNQFILAWTSGGVQYTLRIVLPGPGTVQVVSPIPLNAGLPADSGSTLSLLVVNQGSTGSVYQARLLVALR